MHDGAIYGVPSHANAILKVTDEVSLLPVATRGKYKWLRAVTTAAGIIGIPSWASQVLHISDHVTTFGDLPEGKWKWHGGQVCPLDGCVYAPPANAQGVLKIDPVRQRCELLGDFKGPSQYYGAIQGDDAVYGIPFAADNVLRVDPDGPTTLGKLPAGYETSWHGGLKCHFTGRIYGFPAHADSVLVIDDKVHLLPVPGPRGRYQWAGGVQCPKSGAIYGIPSDAPDVLKITLDGTVSRFGHVRSKDEPYKNLWQNAVLGPDGCFYAIPADANVVLKLDPSDDSLTRLGKGIVPVGKDKFQGGFLSGTSIWCLPESADALLQIDFSTGTPTLTLKEV